MRDNNVTPGGMVSVLGNLMMWRSIYDTRRPRRTGNGSSPGEPQMAAALKTSSQHASAVGNSPSPASVGHQTPQALHDRDGAPIIVARSEPKASSIWHGHVMGAV
jgi:hypothetical protein